MYRVGIITASDKGSRGERVDESGAKIKEIAGEFGYEVKFYRVLPDDKESSARSIQKAAVWHSQTHPPCFCDKSLSCRNSRIRS